MNFIVARTFSSLYIFLDIFWLLIVCGVLMLCKRRLAVIVGLVAGFVYFVVDYGIFYKLLGTRQVSGADPFWFLLWLSMSYGFTNFAWIWLLLDRDGYAVEWSLLPILGWVAVGQLSCNFGAQFAAISISRGTDTYHGMMSLILCIGYLVLLYRNVRKKEQINILWLMAIGIGVQFAWELALLINGIRPPLWQPLVLNSLIETNLGMPYIYLIHKHVTRYWKEDLTTVKN